MLSCKQTSQLISQSLDRRLSGRERLALRFHLMMCDACTRFGKQLAMLRLAVRRLTQEIEQNESVQLSQEARKRITHAIESNRK